MQIIEFFAELIGDFPKLLNQLLLSSNVVVAKSAESNLILIQGGRVYLLPFIFL